MKVNQLEEQKPEGKRGALHAQHPANVEKAPETAKQAAVPEEAKAGKEEKPVKQTEKRGAKRKTKAVEHHEQELKAAEQKPAAKEAAAAETAVKEPAAKKAVAEEPAAKKAITEQTAEKEAAPVKVQEAKQAAPAEEQSVKTRARGASGLSKNLKTRMVFEFDGKQIDAGAVMQLVEKEAVKKSASQIKTLEVYVNSYENAAYYVINGEGSDDYRIEL